VMASINMAKGIRLRLGTNLLGQVLTQLKDVVIYIAELVFFGWEWLMNIIIEYLAPFTIDDLNFQFNLPFSLMFGDWDPNNKPELSVSLDGKHATGRWMIKFDIVEAFTGLLDMILNYVSSSFTTLLIDLNLISVPPYDNGDTCLFSSHCASKYCSWSFICEQPESATLALLASKGASALPAPANTTMVDTRKLALSMMPWTGNDAGEFRNLVQATGLHAMEHHMPAHVIRASDVHGKFQKHVDEYHATERGQAIKLEWEKQAKERHEKQARDARSEEEAEKEELDRLKAHEHKLRQQKAQAQAKEA